MNSLITVQLLCFQKQESHILLLCLFACFPSVNSFQNVTLNILFMLVVCVQDLANFRAIKFPSSLKATIPYKQILFLFSTDVPVSINGPTANR